MLINQDHRSWALAFVLLTTVATVHYWYYSSAALYGPTGGSWTGLTYGILGTTLMVLAGLLSLRKRYRTRRLGSARVWLNLHLWGGLLSVPLILFHSGFALGGHLTTVLMLLFAIVILSGLFGLLMQQLIPRIMTERLPAETLRTQIDHVRYGLAADAYDIVAAVTGHLGEAAEEQDWLKAEKKAGWKAPLRHEAAPAPAAGVEPLRDLYLNHVRPYLRRLPDAGLALPDLVAASLETPAEFLPRVEQLRSLCEESRQLDLQLRLHGWLHNWLFVHAPLSIALFVLVAFHIWFALRY